MKCGRPAAATVARRMPTRDDRQLTFTIPVVLFPTCRRPLATGGLPRPHLSFLALPSPRSVSTAPVLPPPPPSPPLPLVMAGGTPTAEESALAAAAYARWSAPFTGRFVPAVLEAAAPVGPGTRLLDVATGTGVAAMAAAATGATVLATDLSPGMVDAAGAALAPYPTATVKAMDGTALEVADGTYDVVLSVFGVMTFPDWEAGLREVVRVTAPGGRLVLSTWTCADGAGFFPTVLATYRSTFPDKPSPCLGAGVAALSTPDKITAALTAAGAERITVRPVEQAWVGPPAVGAVEVLTRLFQRAPFYKALTEDELAVFHPRLEAALGRYAGDDGIIRIPSLALVTLAHKPAV